MIILGLSPLDKDSTVTLMKDGRVLFAAGEERFTRTKLQDGFPAESLQAGLEYTGISLEEIDQVAYPFFDWKKETEMFTQNLENEEKFIDSVSKGPMRKAIEAALSQVPKRSAGIPGLSDPNETMKKGVMHKIFYRMAGMEGVISRNLAKRGSASWGRAAQAYHKVWQDELDTNLKELNLLKKLKRYDHHSAHAAAAYYSSKFERTLIVTLDGYGSGLAGSVSIGENNKIKRIHKIEYPHSLGTFYESVTSSLGFKPSRHEGKIVGLAAYGDPKVLTDLVLGRFHESPGSFLIR